MLDYQKITKVLKNSQQNNSETVTNYYEKHMHFQKKNILDNLR